MHEYFPNENLSLYDNSTNDTNISLLQNNDDYRDDFWHSFQLAMPLWEAILTGVTLGSIILITVVGNILVIISVFTYRPLRIVPNFFLVSLAIADLTVSIMVLPLNVAYSIIGRWIFGFHLCQLWLTSDILCCTASILNLCAIALDRFWAITDPLNYAQKRTVKRVMSMIIILWVISIIICLPPLLGWNDWPEIFDEDTPCTLSSDRGFVIYSSMGSFYVPLVIMTLVYIKIFLATRRRLRERANASKISYFKTEITMMQADEDSMVGDGGQNGLKLSYKKICKFKRKRKKRALEDKISLPMNPSNEESTADNDCSRDTQSRCNNTADIVVHIIPKTPNQVSQFIEEKAKISLSKERRAARTLGIIMGVFVICWLPFFLTYVILPYCTGCTPPNDKVMNFIAWLGYINSGLNPIIYTIFNTDFRKAFARILKCSTVNQ